MIRHSFRLLLIALAAILPIALTGDLYAADGVSVPPQRVTFSVTLDGPTLRWWQASSATDVAILDDCDAAGRPDELITYEPGQPGWHTRHILQEDIFHACLRISEFDDGDWIGYYGPYPFAPWLQILPVVGR